MFRVFFLTRSVFVDHHDPASGEDELRASGHPVGRACHGDLLFIRAVCVDDPYVATAQERELGTKSGNQTGLPGPGGVIPANGA